MRIWSRAADAAPANAATPTAAAVEKAMNLLFTLISIVTGTMQLTRPSACQSSDAPRAGAPLLAIWRFQFMTI